MLDSFKNYLGTLGLQVGTLGLQVGELTGQGVQEAACSFTKLGLVRHSIILFLLSFNDNFVRE